MNAQPPPSPDLFFDTLTAYQRTAALKAAVDLDLFTVLSDGPLTAAGVAARCHAAARGIRILCDYMTVIGFLQKAGDHYRSTPDSEVFLNRKSPAYLGGAMEFLLSDPLTQAFKHLTKAVCNGGTTEPPQGSITPEHPMWLTFAHAMGGLMFPA